ncbi:hypothetical protein QTP88_018858 [Uroleucon formosanum]
MVDNGNRELRKLNKQKERIQAGVQVIKKYVEKFDPGSQSIKQIQVRLEKLIAHIVAFDEVQTELLNCDEAVDNINEQLKFGDETCTLRADMEDLISKFSVVEVDNSLRVSHLSASDAIRLPTIQPPTFSGNLEDWSSFFDTFNALFHNNASLTDVQRLHYLKSSVLGPAADIIKNFSITADNYKVAYEELVHHYENKGFTIQSHIRSLLQTPKIAVASASELRQLHHHVASHVRALRALGQPVMHWDAWLVTLICGQLDSISSVSVSEKQNRAKTPQNTGKILFTRPNDNKVFKCPLCGAAHRVFNCNEFTKMTVSDRKEVALRLKLCYNCLNYGHQVKDCKFSACPICNKRHNSKLHEEQDVAVLSNQPNQSASSETNAVLCAELTKFTLSMHVMLATASVYVHDINDCPQLCRAVLDSGSQLNLVTLACVKRLGFSSTRSTCNIVGVGGMASKSKCLPLTYVSSRFGSHKRSILLHSLPSIVNSLPAQTIDTDNLNIPEHIRNQLADPQFNVSGSIDILVGTEIFFDILSGEKWPLTVLSSLHSTDFGWIVVGKLPIASRQLEYQSLSLTGTSPLSLFTATSLQPAAVEQAEKHFASTVSRDTNGRFIVKLPFARDPHVLGDSRQMAQRRFLNLEKCFAKEPGLAQRYKTFMAEYLSMDYMEVADPEYSGPVYYLPHHAVLKAESLTTKLRVVFDSSAVSTSGLSLNDILLKGPKTQPDLINVLLLRFRVHRIAVTANIEKMYRQIRLASEDCEL